jgi:hypothetical protein
MAVEKVTKEEAAKIAADLRMRAVAERRVAHGLREDAAAMDERARRNERLAAEWDLAAKGGDLI